MKFKSHGDFNIELRGNILITDAFGPWNRETAIEFAKECEKALAPIFHQRAFALLTDISCWELGTPDIVQIHEFNLQKSIEAGCTCQAVVNSTGKIKFEQFNQRSPISKQFERKFFDTKYFAVEWLSIQGFYLF
ncbi:hypothetical protein OAP14_05895 [Aliiglaciecola sp.]|nr:hypothetical protein [Aliiglaciecola sp.]